MNIIPLTKTPVYVAAREQANRLQDELAKLELEIDALSTSRIAAQTGNAWLARGVAALEGDLPDSPKLAELTRRRDAVARAIRPAHLEIEAATRSASRDYFQTQANAVLDAEDGLIVALESVLAACAVFKSIRGEGEALGYDPESSGLPLSIDKKFSDWVDATLPELKKDADRLRDSLDKSLDHSSIYVLALCDMPLYGLKCGEAGQVPARIAKELVRSGTAEESSPGRSRMSKLKSLIGA